VVIVCSKFHRNLITPDWVIHNLTIFFSRYVSLRPSPLTPWLCTFVVLPASCVQTLYKIWAKSHNPPQSYLPFSTFSPSSSRGGHFLRTVLRGAWTELHQTCRGHWTNTVSYEFVSELRYLAAFSNAGASKLSDVENDAKFRTFWSPVKIRGGVGDLSRQIIGAAPTTEPSECIWWPYSARLLTAMSRGKNEKSTAVNLTVFRLTSRCLMKADMLCAITQTFYECLSFVSVLTSNVYQHETVKLFLAVHQLLAICGYYALVKCRGS